MEGFLFSASIYLGAAVLAVPVAARLGLGSVLGYLAAGILIGPVLGLVGAETKDLQHFAEFGVVMMLFLIGLELEPRALWDMRHRLIGLGGLQITLTTLAFMGGAMLLGFNWSISLAVGLIFALSSTAIVLQTLSEKGLIRTAGGTIDIFSAANARYFGNPDARAFAIACDAQGHDIKRRWLNRAAFRQPKQWRSQHA